MAFVITIARNLLRDAFRQERARPRTNSLDALIEGDGRNPDGALPASSEDVAATVSSRARWQRRWACRSRSC